MKFRYLPIELDLIQWRGSNYTEITSFCVDPSRLNYEHGILQIKNNDNIWLMVPVGAWIRQDTCGYISADVNHLHMDRVQ